MTKFWMTTIAIVACLSAGLQIGCPDGDDDADADCIPACAPGYVCLYGDCVPEGSDTDADADSDTSEDDADTSEAANCPSVAGEWALVYRNSETGMESHETLTLTQDGCLIIGMDDYCEWSGTITESGYISVFVDCPTNDQTVTGNFQTPPTWRASTTTRPPAQAPGGPTPSDNGPREFSEEENARGHFFIF